MPIYAYKCGSCGHAKDVLQKISDAPLAVCPACGAASFTKQVTAAGFQLKGSGWYATDFRGGASNAAAGANGARNGEGAKIDDGAAKPADGAAKPAESSAKPAEGASSAKSDAPKASAGGSRSGSR
jgi:putative FmdB family regulatory protein